MSGFLEFLFFFFVIVFTDDWRAVDGKAGHARGLDDNVTRVGMHGRCLDLRGRNDGVV